MKSMNRGGKNLDHWFRVMFHAACGCSRLLYMEATSTTEVKQRVQLQFPNRQGKIRVWDVQPVEPRNSLAFAADTHLKNGTVEHDHMFALNHEHALAKVYEKHGCCNIKNVHIL